MKVKVLRNFKDKYTKIHHKANTEIEISKERYEEINSTAHGVLVEKIEQEDVALKKMNKESLVKYAKEVKGIELSMTKTKQEMIDLIEAGD